MRPRACPVGAGRCVMDSLRSPNEPRLCQLQVGGRGYAEPAPGGALCSRSRFASHEKKAGPAPPLPNPGGRARPDTRRAVHAAMPTNSPSSRTEHPVWKSYFKPRPPSFSGSQSITLCVQGIGSRDSARYVAHTGGKHLLSGRATCLSGPPRRRLLGSGRLSTGARRFGGLTPSSEFSMMPVGHWRRQGGAS
jgi:hypothetical protein